MLTVAGVLFVVAALVGSFLAGRATATTAAPEVTAPELLTPVSGERFGYYPRELTLVWQAVPGATHYTLDIQGQYEQTWFSHPGNGHQENLTGTSYSFEFVGAQPGRWRVTAFGQDGSAGPPSEWSTFSFDR